MDYMSETTTSLVPELYRSIQGNYYGGAYWNNQELALHCVSDGTGGFTLTIEDTRGFPLGTHEIPATDAKLIRDTLGKPRRGPAVKTISGLSERLTWGNLVPNDDRYEVSLNGGELDELHEWLRYATGEETWNSLEDGDDWEW
jgi:hypothetical protein